MPALQHSASPGGRCSLFPPHHIATTAADPTSTNSKGTHVTNFTGANAKPSKDTQKKAKKKSQHQKPRRTDADNKDAVLPRLDLSQPVLRQYTVAKCAPIVGARRLQLPHRQLREVAEQVAVLCCKVAPVRVDDAERTEAEARRRDQRAAAVELDVRRPCDENVASEPRVSARVADHEALRSGGQQRPGAERRLAIGLAGAGQADNGLEPLALLVDERHEHDGDVEDLHARQT